VNWEDIFGGSRIAMQKMPGESAYRGLHCKKRWTFFTGTVWKFERMCAWRVLVLYGRHGLTEDSFGTGGPLGPNCVFDPDDPSP